MTARWRNLRSCAPLLLGRFEVDPHHRAVRHGRTRDEVEALASGAAHVPLLDPPAIDPNLHAIRPVTDLEDEAIGLILAEPALPDGVFGAAGGESLGRTGVEVWVAGGNRGRGRGAPDVVSAHEGNDRTARWRHG